MVGIGHFEAGDAVRIDHAGEGLLGGQLVEIAIHRSQGECWQDLADAGQDLLGGQRSGSLPDRLEDQGFLPGLALPNDFHVYAPL